MKKILILLLMLTQHLIIAAQPETEKPFVIVVCSYNNKKWYKFNLHSIFKQRYTNYRVIYINDCSNDSTGPGVKQFVAEKNQEHRFIYIQNETRCGACANTYNAIKQCKPKEIVLILDGDDWFDGPDVLQNLNYFYQNPDIWMTYGQYRYYPSEKLPQDLDRRPIEFDNFDRKTFRWKVFYPRSFYAKLFHLINEDDLKYEGQFLPMAADVAYMIPLFEMCGKKHSHYINKVLAYYNRGTPINDNKVNVELQKMLEQYIRNKEPYQPLLELWQ